MTAERSQRRDAGLGRLGPIGLALLSLCVAIGLVEIALRLAHFTFELYPRQVVFGWPDPQTIEERYVADRDLFWVTKNYYHDLEAARKIGPTVVLMGCSVTEFGHWDRLLAMKVASELPHSRASFLNVGVGGYTSYQGLKQLRRDILPLHPRIVVIFYGWNDHWVGFGVKDSEVHRVNSVAYEWLRRSRTAQLASKAWVIMRGSRKGEPLRRVPLRDFGANVQMMVEMLKAEGSIPVLVTAPTSIRRGQEPAYLKGRWVTELSEVVPLHQAYVGAVREVANKESTLLCDLARDFESLAVSEDIGSYFMVDGIHTSAEGDARIAELLFECLKEGGLLESLQGNATRTAQ